MLNTVFNHLTTNRDNNYMENYVDYTIHVCCIICFVYKYNQFNTCTHKIEIT